MLPQLHLHLTIQDRYCPELQQEHVFQKHQMSLQDQLLEPLGSVVKLLILNMQHLVRLSKKKNLLSNLLTYYEYMLSHLDWDSCSLVRFRHLWIQLCSNQKFMIWFNITTQLRKHNKNNKINLDKQSHSRLELHPPRAPLNYHLKLSSNSWLTFSDTDCTIAP